MNNYESFKTDLAYSHIYDSYISSFLENWFEGSVEVVNDLVRQKQGIDFIVHTGDKHINIDLKTYRNWHKELYLEKYTNRFTQQDGWLTSAESMTGTYVFYIPSANIVFLASAALLKTVVSFVETLSLEDYLKFYRFNANSNGSYYAVPVSTIQLIAKDKGFTDFVEINLNKLYGAE